MNNKNFYYKKNEIIASPFYILLVRSLFDQKFYVRTNLYIIMIITYRNT